MAQLSSLTVTSSFDLSATTENTSSAGYLWFDNTEVNFMISRNKGVWSNGPNKINATWAGGGLNGSGTQNAALAFGGRVNPSNQTCTEEYNGSSWSAGGALITARNLLTGTGTQNAALAISGNSPGYSSATEEYDGSSWTAGGALINSRDNSASVGIQDSAIVWGGRNPSGGGAVMCCTEEYNGSSWSTGVAALAGIRYQGGTGTQNAVLSGGGQYSPDPSRSGWCVGYTLLYDGTSWSRGNFQINSRTKSQAMGGTQNQAVFAKGRCAGLLTEEYDGTTWSSQNNANNCSTTSVSSAGSPSATIAYGDCSFNTELYTEQLHAKSINGFTS